MAAVILAAMILAAMAAVILAAMAAVILAAMAAATAAVTMPAMPAIMAVPNSRLHSLHSLLLVRILLHPLPYSRPQLAVHKLQLQLPLVVLLFLPSCESAPRLSAHVSLPAAAQLAVVA